MASNKKGIAIADPGGGGGDMAPVSGGSRIFQGGANSPGGSHFTILPNFPKNCMKSKEFMRSGGGGAPLAPPKSATAGPVKISHKKWPPKAAA